MRVGEGFLIITWGTEWRRIDLLSVSIYQDTDCCPDLDLLSE